MLPQQLSAVVGGLVQSTWGGMPARHWQQAK
jgi:hypothetical protein